MMRTHWWIGLALAAVVGCGVETKDDKALTPITETPGDAPAKPSGVTADAGKGGGGGGGGSSSAAIQNTDPSYPRPKADEPKADMPKADEPKKDEAPKTAANALTTEEVAAVNKLEDPADRTSALAQVMCPISSEHLGAMGTPLKKVVDGKSVYLCCKGCEKDFDKDPKAALAKLSPPK